MLSWADGGMNLKTMHGSRKTILQIQDMSNKKVLSQLIHPSQNAFDVLLSFFFCAMYTIDFHRLDPVDQPETALLLGSGPNGNGEYRLAGVCVWTGSLSSARASEITLHNISRNELRPA